MVVLMNAVLAIEDKNDQVGFSNGCFGLFPNQVFSKGLKIEVRRLKATSIDDHKSIAGLIPIVKSRAIEAISRHTWAIVNNS
jgi:hypothetical protein